MGFLQIIGIHFNADLSFSNLPCLFSFLVVNCDRMSSLPPFFESLHRPYHQPLKMARWVCEYINSRKNKIQASQLNVDFYLYALNKLKKIYSIVSDTEYPGLISRTAVDSVSEKFYGLSLKSKRELIQSVLKSERILSVDKQIYSTYKAASYYINLAKEKLELIDNKNRLTQYGENLLSIKSKSDPLLCKLTFDTHD